MSGVPCLSTEALRASGRGPATPFHVPCADGEEFAVSRLLRVLPGKRLVGAALWRGSPVLLKLFVAPESGRHCQRERQGLVLLREAGLPASEMLGEGRLDGGGHYLLTRFLEESRTLENLPPDDARTLALLCSAFRLFGRLHAAGLIQTDPHFGNFLEHAGEVFLIDGDGVERMPEEARKQARAALDNLALLLAQLPFSQESWSDDLLAAYSLEQRRFRPDRALLSRATDTARARRLKDFLGKTLRDCSAFSVERTLRRFTSVVRAEQEKLAPVLDAPDATIAAGALLKDSRTCTVARVAVEGRALAVKRYNLKGFCHALSRCWRPSRAWHAWQAGHRLAFHGVPTPAPLALIEERAGPLRRRAFLITEFCPGENFLQRFVSGREPDTDEAAAINALFGLLFRLRITHGDMKADNFLWREGRLVLIDLDALRWHGKAMTFTRAWRRDRARFLRNWPADSPLYRWLDAHLPEIR
jgi:tRNA A-37 threonylcarbamoyl transferase component Bud32